MRVGSTARAGCRKLQEPARRASRPWPADRARRAERGRQVQSAGCCSIPRRLGTDSIWDPLSTTEAATIAFVSAALKTLIRSRYTLRRALHPTLERHPLTSTNSSSGVGPSEALPAVQATTRWCGLSHFYSNGGEGGAEEYGSRGADIDIVDVAPSGAEEGSESESLFEIGLPWPSDAPEAIREGRGRGSAENGSPFPGLPRI